MIYRLIVFLVLNFGALSLGSLFTSDGVASTWYAELAKAPWTPPGWVFGFAWTSIMICFSVYMAQLWATSETKKVVGVLFSVQWILNVLWNPTFFFYQNATISLVIITLLTIVVGFFLFNYRTTMKLKSLLILPYVVWLLIATSLNWYIVAHN